MKVDSHMNIISTWDINYVMDEIDDQEYGSDGYSSITLRN